MKRTILTVVGIPTIVLCLTGTIHAQVKQWPSRPAPVASPYSVTTAVDQRDPPLGQVTEDAVEPTLQGVVTSLGKLKLSEDERHEIARLIDQLGDEDWYRREAACSTLIKMPVVPESQLLRASRSEDIEVRLRAEKILSEAEGLRSSAVLYDICQTIRAHQIKGAASLLVQKIGRAEDRHLIAAMLDAIAVTARIEDVELLRHELKSNNATVRVGAITALNAVAG
jgi:hypothetical protein